jgi:hypothetical protein
MKNILPSKDWRDRVTKTSPYSGNRMISLTPGQKGHPFLTGLVNPGRVEYASVNNWH